MKFKKAGVIVSAIASTAVCASLIAGSTFALFTSNDKVDITVSSGKVSISAVVDETSLKTYSFGKEQAAGTFENGGTAGFNDEAKFVVGNITPGDSATFNIVVTNDSTVKVKYKVGYTISGELAGALQTEVTGATAGTWTPWKIPVKEAEKTKTISVSVALPESVGNEYQEKSATMDFSIEAIQGNAEVRDDPVIQKNLEKAMADGTYTADGRKTPAGMSLDFSGTSCVVRLADEEAMLYYGHYFDRAAAYEARQEDIANGTVEKTALERKYFNGYNIWYASYYGATTNVVIEKDMDFESDTWTKPLNFYAQTVDGQGHTLAYANIVASGDAGEAGLFTGSANYTNFTVKNVVADGSATTGNSAAGVAVANSNATISNVTVEDSKAFGAKYTGGVVGYGYASVKNCTLKKVIVTSEYKAGGVIGFQDSSTDTGNSVINNTLDHVTVNVKTTRDTYYTGAFVGHINGNGTIVGNTATDMTIAENKAVGYYTNKGLNAFVSNNTINGVAGEVRGEATYISNVEELKAFRDDVNGGNSYVGKTVMLTADIDLNNEEWTPIGTYGTSTADSHAFSGSFNGNGFTVRNLKIDNAEGVNLGLFGFVQGSAELKNINVENVSIKGQACLGAIVGDGYQGKIQNCHVSGLVEITGNYQVGGLMGYGYASVDFCSVKATEGSFVKGVYLKTDFEGDAIGGLMGYAPEVSKEYTDLAVSGITVIGTRKVGGLFGQAGAYNRTISKVSVANVTVKIEASEEYLSGNAGKIFVGGVIGEVTAGNSNANTCTVKGEAINVTVIGFEADHSKEVAGGTRSSNVTINVKGVTVDNVVVNL